MPPPLGRGASFSRSKGHPRVRAASAGRPCQTGLTAGGQGCRSETPAPLQRTFVEEQRQSLAPDPMPNSCKCVQAGGAMVKLCRNGERDRLGARYGKNERRTLDRRFAPGRGPGLLHCPRRRQRRGATPRSGSQCQGRCCEPGKRQEDAQRLVQGLSGTGSGWRVRRPRCADVRRWTVAPVAKGHSDSAPAPRACHVLHAGQPGAQLPRAARFRHCVA